MGSLATLRRATAILAMLFVAILAACGGGDGPAPAPTPIPTPDTTAPVLSFTPASPLGTTASITVTADEELATGAYGLHVTRAGTTEVAGALAVAADRRSFTWSPSYPLPYATELAVTAIARDASGNEGTASQSFRTVDGPALATWWPPATIAPQGDKVFGVNQLPPGCTTWQSACWQEAVRSGQVKFVASAASAARPVVFAFFRTAAGADAALPMYRDDGSPAGSDIDSAAGFGIDWITGSAAGAIVHAYATGTCTEYFQGGSGWAPRAVTCPVPDTTPPVLTLASASERIPVNGTITIASDEPLADGVAVSGAMYDPRLQGTAALVSGTTVLSQDRRSIAWTPGTLWYDAVLSLEVTAQDLSGNTTTFRVSLTTQLQPAPAGWPPGTIYGVRTVVANPNQLPTGCEPFTTACWQQSVADGTVKFLATGSEVATRPVVYAFFRRGEGTQNPGQAVLASLWLDNATLVPNGLLSGLRGGQLDWVYIVPPGFIIGHETGVATCAEYEFPYAGFIVPPREVPCP